MSIHSKHSLLAVFIISAGCIAGQAVEEYEGPDTSGEPTSTADHGSSTSPATDDATGGASEGGATQSQDDTGSTGADETDDSDETSGSDPSTSGEPGCTPPTLLDATIVAAPDESRGQVHLTWSPVELDAMHLQIALDGALMTEEALAGAPSAFQTPWSVAASMSMSGEIVVDVELFGLCSSGERVVDSATFTFADPVTQCPVPELDAIAGNTGRFYECAELWVNGGDGCGDDGYLIGYGAKYAEKFYTETRPFLSPEGQLWLDDVLVCLQTRLRDEIRIGTSCEAIRSTGFGQHPECYADSGACELPPGDLAFVALTIEQAEWATPESLQQVADLSQLCSFGQLPPLE